MTPADAPLNRDRILNTAEDVIRRFGPDKATVVDVARALGVSHAAVYRHVATKAELRDLVVGRWVETIMPPLRAIAAGKGAAPARLRPIQTLRLSPHLDVCLFSCDGKEYLVAATSQGAVVLSGREPGAPTEHPQ